MEIELTTGKIELRALTFREIRAGKDFGISCAGIRDLIKDVDAAIEYMMNCLYGETPPDALLDAPWPEVRKKFFLDGVFESTYASEESLKNSKGSGLPEQTQS